MNQTNPVFFTLCIILLYAFKATTGGAAEIARKRQNPLASINPLLAFGEHFVT